MDPSRESALLKLAENCQRLVRQARNVLLGVTPVDPDCTAEADRLVLRALELLGPLATVPTMSGASAGKPAIAYVPTTAGAASAAPEKAGGIALRMIRQGRVETQPTGRVTGMAPSGRHMLTLSGLAESFQTPDLIGFLSAQKKTGVLEIVTADEVFLLELLDGDIVHAQSDHTPTGQRLGDILVDRHSVDRDALEKARKQTPGPRLGATLVQDGLVSQENLLKALETQIQQLFQRLFNAPMKSFSFWNGPPIYADEKLRLNATSLLLEGARISDEKNWLGKIG